MKRLASVLTSMGLALVLGASVTTQLASAQDTQILVQDLKRLRVPGRISAVLWTRRKEYFTLQILFNNAPTATKHMDAQIWLLRADGSNISPTGRWETPPSKKNCVRCLGYEVEYSFPLSGSSEAVAVAMGVSDNFFIEKLDRFPE
ncbi:MAG TPA: hypothetical protein VGM97_12735 [Steroidobacteraceae bacterium]|jgi:hypothetical protein